MIETSGIRSVFAQPKSLLKRAAWQAYVFYCNVFRAAHRTNDG
jgi:hypothetical protein